MVNTISFIVPSSLKIAFWTWFLWRRLQTDEFFKLDLQSYLIREFGVTLCNVLYFRNNWFAAPLMLRIKISCSSFFLSAKHESLLVLDFQGKKGHNCDKQYTLVTCPCYIGSPFDSEHVNV